MKKMNKSEIKTQLTYIIGYIYNNIVTYIPSHKLRNAALRMMGAKIGSESRIDMKTIIRRPTRLSMGNHVHINSDCIIQALAPIVIGNNVTISFRTSIIAGSHDIDSPDFKGDHHPICIEDYVFIGANSTILNNVIIGKGAVVCAGAVVTKNVAPYTIVGGVPAKKIGERSRDLHYTVLGNESYFMLQ